MNKYLAIFLISLLSSCCTSIECLNAFDTNEIKLISFNEGNLDSIFVVSYEKNNNFLAVLDSQFTQAIKRSSLEDEELTIPMPIDLNQQSDYKIYIPKTGDTYEITNIKTDLEKCNACFLTTDKFTVLSGYQVNGVEQSKDFFEIIK